MKNKFESFQDDNLPEGAVEALKSGKTIIRQVLIKEERADGSKSSHPYRIQTQQLKSRKVTLANTGQSVGAIINAGNLGGSLTTVNATNWLAMTKKDFFAMFDGIFKEKKFKGYDVKDEDEVINADILAKGGVEILVYENFVAERSDDSPKRKGASGEVVTASFNGRQMPVFRHTNLIVKGSSEGDLFINPNGAYVGNPATPIESAVTAQKAAVETED